MAKLSGFFMSTLLIVLCLWINVSHYPDAARTSAFDGVNPAVPIDETRRSVDVEPQTAPPASQQAPASKTDAEEPARQNGLFADGGTAPKLLDVSASSQSNAPSNPDSAATVPVLNPASFPVDGAEIDDAPAPERDAKSKGLNVSFDASTSETSPLDSTVSTAQIASPSLASQTQEVRRSATKPRGAKYVRVPDVEIDAFSGSVRASRSLNNETRVVGATRAGQTLRVAPTAAP